MIRYAREFLFRLSIVVAGAFCTLPALAQIGPIPFGPVMFAAHLSCSGGSHTTAGGHDIYTFASGGSLTCVGAGQITELIVGGGGAGGSAGGGGGCGGYILASVILTAGTYTVTIGSGGTPTIGAVGGNGTASTFNGQTAGGGVQTGTVGPAGCAGAGAGGLNAGVGGNASANTGSGGGSGGPSGAGNASGGAGGSGIVIVSI